jgi:hypothetical protein
VAHLACQAEALIVWECLRDYVNRISKGNGFIPDFQFFKVEHIGAVILSQPSTFNPQPLSGSR